MDLSVNELLKVLNDIDDYKVLDSNYRSMIDANIFLYQFDFFRIIKDAFSILNLHVYDEKNRKLFRIINGEIYPYRSTKPVFMLRDYLEYLIYYEDYLLKSIRNHDIRRGYYNIIEYVKKMHVDYLKFSDVKYTFNLENEPSININRDIWFIGDDSFIKLGVQSIKIVHGCIYVYSSKQPYEYYFIPYDIVIEQLKPEINELLLERMRIRRNNYEILAKLKSVIKENIGKWYVANKL